MNCPKCAETMNHCNSLDIPPVVGYFCDSCKEFFYPDQLIDDESYTPSSIYDVLEFEDDETYIGNPPLDNDEWFGFS